MTEAEFNVACFRVELALLKTMDIEEILCRLAKWDALDLGVFANLTKELVLDSYDVEIFDGS